MITAEQIRATKVSATKGAAEAFAQLRALDELKAKVADLQHLQVHADTNEAAEAAARELLGAAEDSRVGEIMRPRREAAVKEAQQKTKAAAVSACHAIANHYEKLGREANEVAWSVVYALMSPAARAVSQYEPQGKRRDYHAQEITEHFPACSIAWPLYHEANYATIGDASSADTTSDRLLETFDADTNRIRAEIAHLKGILAFLKRDEPQHAEPEINLLSDGDKKQGGAAESSSPPAVPATAEPELAEA